MTKPRKRARLLVVVPCRNEAEGIPALGAALDAWAAEEARLRPVDFVFVDDGSDDDTAPALDRARASARCPALRGAALVRHPVGLGLTAALQSGLGAAPGEHREDDLVAWIDADQTYDVALLSRLASAVDDGADVACVSPYHPDGGVEGVHGWRLALSRGASSAWRLVTRRRGLHTFTSMVRVWRRHWLERVHPRHGGFLGITETLVRAVRQGAQVAEVPAVLGRRRTGRSKMGGSPAAVLRLVRGHLGLMAAYLLGRLDPPTTGESSGTTEPGGTAPSRQPRSPFGAD